MYVLGKGANSKKGRPGVPGLNQSLPMMAAASDHHPTDSILEKYLQAHLKLPHQEKGHLHCHVLSDHFSEKDWAAESFPSPFISATEYLSARHLILIFQTQIGSPDKKWLEGPVLVLGLCVVEYAHRCHSSSHTSHLKQSGIMTRSYIQYVDTTGLIKPRSLQGLLTRNLVKTYIRFARDVLQVSHIHLFASPKPSLIFAGTEQIGKKALLAGKQLISWWLAILTDSLSDSEHCNLFAFSPGEEPLPASAKFTRICVDRLSRYNSPHFNVHYGMPYRPENEALSHIPAFQDDPKWRHIEALSEHLIEKTSRKRQRREMSSLTVREFFETLAYRSDFAKDHSALICASFNQNSSVVCQTPIRHSESATCVLNILKTISFESENEAFKSSSRVLGLIKILGSIGFPIDVWNVMENLENQCPEQSDRFKTVFNLLNHTSDQIHHHFRHSSENISDLQSLIKRKTPRGQVNSLGS